MVHNQGMLVASDGFALSSPFRHSQLHAFWSFPNSSVLIDKLHKNNEINAAATARLWILGLAPLLLLCFLAIKRFYTKKPFLPSKQQRSSEVINVKEFLELYPKEDLPSQAPVEELKGARFWCTCLIQGLLLGLVVVDVKALLQRWNQKDYQEEAVELYFYAILASIYLFRFFPTPYRRTINTATFFLNVVPLIILCTRDLWPKLLVHPSETLQHYARDGPCFYLRISFMLGIICVYMGTPRVWYQVDPYTKDEVSPEQVASLFSYLMSYYWIEFLIRRAYNHTIETSDLPNVPDYDRGRLWERKLANNDQGTSFKTLLRVMRTDLLFMISAAILMALASSISPLSMKALLAYIEGSSEPFVNPYVYVFGLFLGPALYSLSLQGYCFRSTRLIVRVKAAYTQSLLKKTLRIRFNTDSKKDNEKDKEPEPKKGAKPEKKKAEIQQSKVGMIYNLMSSDLEALVNARDFFLLAALMPIELVFAVVVLYNLLGWSSLVGVGISLVTMPLPAYLATSLSSMQKEARKATDARIGVITEVLNSIRIIKYFGWEDAMLERIRVKRAAEMWLTFKCMAFGLSFYIISIILPLINMMTTFVLYTKVMKKPLTASVAFTSISMFEIVRSQFVYASWAVQQIITAFVSFDRLDKFMNGEPELDSKSLAKMENQDEPNPEAQQSGPSFKNATLSWVEAGSKDDNGFRLHDLNVECPYGKLTVVTGAIGTGKSSFLMGLLEEMHLLEGEVYMPRAAGIAIATQTPWLQQASIKDNILFGSDFVESRYQDVLESCALIQDLDNYEAGDLTEIGEKGITLSGGQKARLSLARAVYSRAQTVLLDDVFSALDAGTSKVVFEKCIKGDILSGRTVVLVTHQIHLVSKAASKIILLEDGKIISDTTPEALPIEIMEVLDEAVETKADAEEEAKLADEEIALAQEDSNPDNTVKKDKKPAAKLVLEEERAIGRVPKTLVFKYMQSFGGIGIVIILLLFTLIDEGASILSTLFIGLWADAYSKPGEVNVNWWLTMYAVVLLGTTVTSVGTYLCWYIATWLSARRLHNQLAKAVLFSPVRFFDTTPVGRILNRFSKDVKSIDSSLGSYLRYALSQYLDLILRIGVLSGLVPKFLIPTFAISVFGLIIGEMYVRAQMAVKRLISVKESPLFSHFGDTIAGIVVIRAYGVGNTFLEKNLKLIDEYTQPNEALYNLNRWMGIRIEVSTALVGLFAGYLGLTSNLSPGLVGFSLASSLSFTSSVLQAIRCSNQLEVELNSFERIGEYINLKQELAFTEEGKPPAAWPTSGDVKVENLSVKYSTDGPDVLHNISFDVKAGERVGIVGRTGAGKSSMALSLLRFTEFSGGKISINGRDIASVNLLDLRQRVTIIPQDPVIFSGTIRSNLDPFGERDDTELQEALQSSGLANVEVVADVDSGIATPSNDSGASSTNQDAVDTNKATKTKAITLDTPVSSGGENFSQGQKQLVALARALVRRSKLVILDEATSSTDADTDERVQETLRTNFADSTLITIAHRLSTVMGFDRILVLDNRGNGGEVVEYDTPYELLKNKQGILYNLAQKSGDFEALSKLAKR